MAPGGNSRSRNPNLCASCSSMWDGMEEREPLPDADSSLDTPSAKPPEPAQVIVGDDVRSL